ncbi:hypothetical protein ZTR_07325 [Talaromyces verruculosus]|nr:hypothetical protein ZTR_07325 [Talaromyces verruculosus]
MTSATAAGSPKIMILLTMYHAQVSYPSTNKDLLHVSVLVVPMMSACKQLIFLTDFSAFQHILADERGSTVCYSINPVMNGYKTRPSHEQHYNNTSESTSMATVYETTPTAELPYHSSGTYNVLQPYNSYSSHLPPYFEPQASMGLQSPDMHTVPSIRHDQHLSQHHHPYRQEGYSGYPVDMPSRFTSIRGIPEHEIESQDSINEQTMSSERINPPLEGFPLVEDFDKLMESYVNELSVKKQDKALINAQRAQHIRIVLTDPKDTSVGSAQFRFWVKKMFKLEPADSRLPMNRKWICHEGKPVAIREKLFKILTRAHQQCQHGGRDKTSAQSVVEDHIFPLQIQGETRLLWSSAECNHHSHRWHICVHNQFHRWEPMTNTDETPLLPHHTVIQTEEIENGEHIHPQPRVIVKWHGHPLLPIISIPIPIDIIMAVARTRQHHLLLRGRWQARTRRPKRSIFRGMWRLTRIVDIELGTDPLVL